MPNPENLIPFVKGDPRRINKPKGATSVVADLRRLMEKKMPITDPVTGKPIKTKISKIVAMKLIKNAINGDIRAIQEVMERIDGKTPSNMNIGGQPNNPLGVSLNIILSNGHNSDGKTDSSVQPS